MPKPFLSVGIIFKNEIRCLERCLKSLAPLREAIACEVVMADTGSDDGSREIAEKYADILFDFPWVDDFAAARNAVMDRCTGRWYLSIDADEWMDEDLAELTAFIRANNRKAGDAFRLRIRNYMNQNDLQDGCDFFAMRLVRMSTGLRFRGAIHEVWKYDDGRPLCARNLPKTLLHHDGYLGLNGPEGALKRKRNLEILAAELEAEPENVRLLLQYIESSRPDEDHVDYIRRGIEAVESKKPEWKLFGPVIFRYAVLAAKERKLPELEEWIARSEELFPDSFYTTIDIGFHAFFYWWEQKEYSKCLQYGKTYLTAIEDYEAGRGDQVALLASTLVFAGSSWVRLLRAVLAAAFRKNGQPEASLEILETLEPLSGDLVKETLYTLWELQVSTAQDTSVHMLNFYERITGEEDEKRAELLMEAFLKTAPIAFGPDVREQEAAREDFHRYSYTVFLPLAGKCEAGSAAAVMEAEDVQEMDELLCLVKDWGDFSVSALIHALEKGAAFPPEGTKMHLAEMGRIVKRLSQYRTRFFRMVCQAAPRQCSGNWQQLTWARFLVLAAAQGFGWKDEKLGLALAKAFANVMGAFVSRCYTPEVLCEENMDVLPPMHRFGWYCVQAFDALEAGDPMGYVRFLRTGLHFCEGMKPMVEFLTRHTPELQRSTPSPELLALANQIRVILARYDANDPAVAALKASPAYQKAAWLIEAASLPPAHLQDKMF